MDTIFSKIIKREIPAYIVYEDEFVIAFLDITQATKGHTLVVTKGAYKNIFEVPETLFTHLFGVVQKLSVAIYKAFDATGLNLLNNNNPVAGQTVFHYHVHIIPRYSKEELSVVLENNMAEVTTEEYKKRTELITSALL